MIEIFKILNGAYQANDFNIILNHQFGNYFLKLRSLSRSEILKNLALLANVNVSNIPSRKLLEYLFCQNILQETIDGFIAEVYQVERNLRLQNEEQLYHDLYRLNNLNSGGFHQSEVEVYIVKNYIKDISDLDILEAKVQNELNGKIRNYVLWSWYNFWTSVLIEDIFKDHPDIIPAVGLVKKVDFFWNNFPFDLKVTFFPDGFMKLKRRHRGLPEREIIELRAFARKNKIPFDKTLNDDDQFVQLINRITENPNEKNNLFLQSFNNNRTEIIDETLENPEELIVWFYENQAPRRFDAANRFFLVLIDRNHLDESWKLKRNGDVLKEKINSFLNANQNIDFDQYRTNFNWESANYECYATCLFVVRE